MAKESFITLRLGGFERMKLEREAEIVGLKVSSYVRAVALEVTTKRLKAREKAAAKERSA